MNINKFKIFRRLRSVLTEVSILVLYVFNTVIKRNEFNFKIYRKLNLPKWYHDFSCVGIKTNLYEICHHDKEAVIFKFLQMASEIVKAKNKFENKKTCSLVELFCADAYYSIYSLHRALVDSAVGVDLEEGSGEGIIRSGVLAQADMISKLCGFQNKLLLNKCDVMEYEGMFDICLCAGGLYHITDPLRLLERVTQQTQHVLVIQTVIPSNTNEDNPFYVAPAPHWTWGCRFNKKYLIDGLEAMGWIVLESDIKHMPANSYDWDDVSLYLICLKSPSQENSFS